jgi:hypothetical protein
MKNTPHFNDTIIETWYAEFGAAMGYPPDLPIGHTNARRDEVFRERGVYVAKEIFEHYGNESKRVWLLIDTTDSDSIPRPSFEVRHYVPWATITYAVRSQEPAALLRPLRALCRGPKHNFCSFFYQPTERKKRVWAANEYHIRERFCELLDQLKPVGKPLPDGMRYSIGFLDAAVRTHIPYRFNIAFENANQPGWITEKFVNAFLAGTIPIYWGSDYVYHFFNPHAFIHVNAFPSLEAAADFVMQVDSDNTLYQRFLGQPPCTESGWRRLFGCRRPQ